MPAQPEFDAYYKWLGIPPSEQPPDCYRLLGVVRFESDPDVIEAAADQRMAHIRTYQTGKHGAASQRILNELADARVTLLNPAKKAAYDAELRKSEPPEMPRTELPPLAFPVSPAIGRAKTSSKKRHSAAFIGGGVIAVMLVAGAVAMMTANRNAAGRKAPSRRPNTDGPLRDERPASTLHAKQKSTTRSPAPTAPPAVVTTTGSAPFRIMQTKTETYHQDGLDVARCEKGAFVVSTGGDVGEAAAGFELEGARRLHLEAAVKGTLRPYDENSFAGFIVDYHTAAGYSHRVALSLGLSADRRTSRGPLWGKQLPPDRSVDLADADVREIGLDAWAPAEWDGRIWFSVLLQNSGMQTAIEGRLIEPAPAVPVTGE